MAARKCETFSVCCTVFLFLREVCFINQKAFVNTHTTSLSVLSNEESFFCYIIEFIDVFEKINRKKLSMGFPKDSVVVVLLSSNFLDISGGFSKQTH